MRIEVTVWTLLSIGALAVACGSSSKGEPQSHATTEGSLSDTVSAEAGSGCAGLEGGPALGGLPADASASGPCGAGGTCVQGPFCTPGGCTEAGAWVCAYSTEGPCRVSNGQLVCGPSDGGATD